uniref:Uncharacterized protein n=1 Tax=Oncorhynchus mykiss TaxID=8022 RepID=A0A8C7VLB0_ONCMY
DLPVIFISSFRAGVQFWDAPPTAQLRPLPRAGVHSDRSPGPAFSFGMRHQQLSSDRSPGPASAPLRITHTYRLKTYNMKLCSYCLFGVSGRYSTESKGFHNDQTPGPAAYMQPSVLGPATVNKTSTPNFSRRGCSKMVSFHEDLQKVDLTWTFRVVDPCTYKQKPPHYSMTGCNSMPGDTTMKPGPELTTLNRIKPPSFTFKIHHSEFIAPLIVDVV